MYGNFIWLALQRQLPIYLTQTNHINIRLENAFPFHLHEKVVRGWKELRIRNTFSAFQVRDINSWKPYWKWHKWMNEPEIERVRERERESSGKERQRLQLIINVICKVRGRSAEIFSCRQQLQLLLVPCPNPSEATSPASSPAPAPSPASVRFTSCPAASCISADCLPQINLHVQMNVELNFLMHEMCA